MAGGVLSFGSSGGVGGGGGGGCGGGAGGSASLAVCVTIIAVGSVMGGASSELVNVVEAVVGCDGWPGCC